MAQNCAKNKKKKKAQSYGVWDLLEGERVGFFFPPLTGHESYLMAGLGGRGHLEAVTFKNVCWLYTNSLENWRRLN